MERTIQERQSLVYAERAAFFRSGSQSIRQHLAVEWDIEQFHRRCFGATIGAKNVLEQFLGHQGTMEQLESIYEELLFGDIAALMDQIT